MTALSHYQGLPSERALALERYVLPGLGPFELNLLLVVGRGTEVKITKEGSHELDGLYDALVVRLVVVLQPIEEGRQVTCIVAQVLVVVDAMNLLDQGAVASVMEVVGTRQLRIGGTTYS